MYSTIGASAVCCAGFGDNTTLGIFLDDVMCSGHESSIYNCSHNPWYSHNCGHHEDAGVRCGSKVRLVDGQTQYEGRIEIYYNGSWGTICDDNWDDNDAAVVCRMLGYSTIGASAVCCAGFGNNTSLGIFLDDVMCSGHESSIYNCSHNPWYSHNCGHHEDAGVRCGCLPGSKVRLVDGQTQYEGRVEIYYNGSWGTICDDNWDNNDATVVCRMLGYSTIGASAVCCAGFGNNTSLGIFLDDVMCSGHESSIYNCSHNPWYSHNCGHHEDAGVRCGCLPGSKVRLVDGQTQYEGRVEIYYNGSWGTICDDNWDNNDATVVCRMLGYSTIGASAVCCAGFGNNTSLGIFLDDVMCSGHESSIYNCSHNPWYSHNCGHHEDAGVRCGCLPGSKVRLVDGQTQYEGRVEIYYNGSWGTICDDNWDNNDATVVCRMLGYSTIGASAVCCAGFGNNTSLGIFLDDVMCSGHESSIYNCSHNPWYSHNCGHHEDAGVRCGSLPGSKVRLVDGQTQYEGRVEIYYNGSWGTICDDNWDNNDATVVCRMLGYSTIGASAVCCAGFGNNTSLGIFLDDVMCSGHESSIYNCSHNPWYSHNCGHHEDAGVRCGSLPGSKVRLVDGQTQYEGRVEIYYNGSWGTICDDNWDNNDATVVCRMLGYSTIGASAVCCAGFGNNTSLGIFLDDVMCSGHESSIYNCSHNPWYSHNCGHHEDAGVRCGSLPGSKVRLVDGQTQYEGRVEIYYNGSWGTICDDNWDNNDATVVCRMLGYSTIGASAVCCAGFGNNTSLGIFLDDVMCSGHESSIYNCSHNPWYSHNCGHHEDAGVRC
ncbi:hypothetical protein ACJMK2_001344, partial [Sinanodonta woodiana]